MTTIIPAGRGVRRDLPDNAYARSHKFKIGGHEGEIVVKLYDDETPGGINMLMLREGWLVQGLLDTMCLAISSALQHGAPMQNIVSDLKGMKFDPSGFTLNPKIPRANSIPDYLAQWLELEFPELMPLKPTKEGVPPAHQEVRWVPTDDCPPCTNCGSTMVREDNGYRCSNCGATAGLG